MLYIPRVQHLCTCPYGEICFISSPYLGSISDPELTKISGFFSVMADGGFTIKDLLTAVRAVLNLPPFLHRKTQLFTDEVKEGCSIASPRIHVECAIGHMKHFKILTGTINSKWLKF